IDLFHFGVEWHQDEHIAFFIRLPRPSEDRGDRHSLRVSRKHSCFGQAHAAKRHTNLRPEARFFDLSDRFLSTYGFLKFKTDQPKVTDFKQFIPKGHGCSVNEVCGVGVSISSAQFFPGLALSEKFEDESAVFDLFVWDTVFEWGCHRDLSLTKTLSDGK